MALLQVRNFPSESYAILALMAEQQKRSITQQTIYMLEQQMKDKISNKSRRLQAISSLQSMKLSLPENVPSAADLIRSDRDRQFMCSNSSAESGRIR